MTGDTSSMEHASPVAIEEMSLNAWPALKTVVHKGCLLRSSDGYTNRANSANPLYSDADDFRDIVEYAEGFYASERLAPVFKILGIPDFETLDAELASRGYGKITETTVMLAELPEADIRTTGVTIRDSFDEDWITACATFNGYSASIRETLSRILAAIRVEKIVASVVIDGTVAACGYGALERGYVGFFDIVVDPELRGNGHGRALMECIMNEARRRGTRAGYLQVVRSNEVATRLYESLGFAPAYTYWYRRLNPAG